MMQGRGLVADISKAVEVADNIRNSMDKCMENRAGSRWDNTG